MTELFIDLGDKADPSHTAVLVIDMQNDFCAEGGFLHNRGIDMSANVALAGRIMKLVSAARAAGALVVWIKANYEPRYLRDPALAKSAATGNGAICCEGGTWGWEFFAVSPEDAEPVVEKYCYNAFFETGLDDILKERGIKTLVTTGVATNVCVESTLRQGYFEGYYIVVPEDCVGSAVEELHQGTLDNVRRYFGDVVTSAELTELWAGGEAARRAG